MDSNFILCGLFKRASAQVGQSPHQRHRPRSSPQSQPLPRTPTLTPTLPPPQAFQVCDKEWQCRVNEGVAGMTSALWCPDSRHILTVSDFHLSLTVWPLHTPNKNYVIKKPKADVPPVFSEDGTLLAVATRLECKDHLAIYDTVSTGR